MKRNRIILLLIIIASGVFASFYGGSVTHTIFYVSLCLPLFGLLYTLYVYLHFCIFQSVESKIIVKGEKTPYKFVLANEDFVAYTNVKVIFLKDKSKIENLEFSRNYCLLPSEIISKETAVSCFYRGEYKVGIKAIEVTDFFNIFKITYPAPSTINMRVLPRIIELDKLSIIPLEEDVKKSVFSISNMQNQPDIDMRKYAPGDSRKMIHWKATAKKQELFTRKYIDIPKSEIVLIMDLCSVNKNELDTVIIEDKIIESTLAIGNYVYKKNMPSKVLFNFNNKNNIINLNSKQNFNSLYNLCVDLRFESEENPGQLLSKCYINSKSNNFCIIITHNITDELCRSCYEALEFGNDIAIIYINNTTTKSDISKLDNRIQICQITDNDDIKNILEKN